ncbi:unnamed protein product [Closterium sp. NIES-54]
MVIVLEKELAALSMRPGEDVKPVLDKIKYTYARISAAGSNVSQMQQCTKIISVLNNSWDNLIPTLNNQQDQWTPEWLQQQVLQEDIRRCHMGGGAANKTVEGYGAAGGSRGRGGGRGRGRGRGFGRGRGRSDYNEGRGSSGGRGSIRMEGDCWYCKNAGHPWFKCFRRHEGWALLGMKPPSGERAGGGAVQGSGAQGDRAQGKAKPGMFLMVEDVKGSEGDVGSVGKVVMHPLIEWVIDSGCTSHITPRADLLDEVKPCGKIKLVAVASGALLCVTGVGNAKVMAANGELVGLGNILLVEGLSTNLLSVQQLQKSKAKVTFGQTSCRARIGKLLLWDMEEKNSCIKDLWQLPIISWNKKPPAMTVVAATAKAAAGEEETAPTDGALDAVKKVQQPQQPHGEVLAGVHGIAAWAKASSGNGDADWEMWNVKVIRTDNRGEFIGTDFEAVLKKKGIQHLLTVPYNPHRNGVAERFNRTLQEGARTLLGRAGLPDPFWVTTLRQVALVKNRVLATVGDKQWAPYTKWYGIAPAVNMLRAYGCMVVFHVPKEKRGKLEASGRWGVHLGIAKDHKGWLVWDLTSQKLTVSRDVKFLESLYYKEWKQQQPKLPTTPLIIEVDEVQRPSRTTFLNGIILEELYMQQPEGLDDGSGRVCRLKKAIYGLKQAPRAWYHKLEETLLAGGFKKSECDHSRFVLQEKDGFLMLLVYVDDILLFSELSALTEHVEEMLEMQFKCSKMGDVKYYLGMHVERYLDKGVLRLHQRKYCEGLAEKYGLQDGGKPTTPLPSGFTVEPCADEEVVGERDKKLFRSMVGALKYAANHMRPDIAFATSKLASVVSRPSHEQLEAAKRLVRYVSATASMGLEYTAVQQRLQRGAADLSKGEMLLTCYIDASFNSVKSDGTSIGGYVCLFGGGAVSWRSKKQNEVGLSSCETVYMALHHGANEVVWLRHLLEEIGVCQMEPTPRRQHNLENSTSVCTQHTACRSPHQPCKRAWHLLLHVIVTVVHVNQAHQADCNRAPVEGRREGIDFQEVFAPVAKAPTLWLLLAAAAVCGWKVEQMDVKTVFLYGVVDEEIYMKQREGYDDGGGRVCRLNKAIYGIKQAPRCWYARLVEALEALGFKVSGRDESLFVTEGEEEKVFLLVYVDDILLFSPSLERIKEVKGKLKETFQCKALGPVGYYFGLHVERDEVKGWLRLHQHKYLAAMGVKYGLEEGRSVKSPLPSGFQLHLDEEEGKVLEYEL